MVQAKHHLALALRLYPNTFNTGLFSERRMTLLLVMYVRTLL